MAKAGGVVGVAWEGGDLVDVVIYLPTLLCSVTEPSRETYRYMLDVCSFWTPIWSPIYTVAVTVTTASTSSITILPVQHCLFTHPSSFPST